jgi:DNA repair protein RadA/Sms
MRWAGQCNGCAEWNTLQEDVVEKGKASSPMKAGLSLSVTPRKISEIEHKSVTRIDTGIGEFNRVLGGGIVPGSVTLLGGEPGIGKSTLTLQVLSKLNALQNIVYVAGEESTEQIYLRANRLGLKLDNVNFLETNVFEHLQSYIEKEHTDLIVVDSIQVFKSIEQSGIAGGITQIRYLTECIVEIAKGKNIPVILIGHVTKDGELAGPKVLEHLVDTVIYIEGDRINSFRFIKTVKNRFGATDEVGIFKMKQEGLIEIPDPAAEFIEAREKSILGATLGCIIEGNRPIMVEVQALTVKSNFGYPKRSTTGFDANRLAMIIAVLQRHYGVDLSEHDVFINVSGGFKIKETACDLAVMQAIVSSYKKTLLKHDTVYIGEVSLSGEIKKVSYEELRANEVKRLGFKKAVVLKT